VLMSKMVWDTLSSEYQEVIVDAAEQAGEFNRQASLEADEELRGKMEEAGVKFNDVDKLAFIEATSGVYDAWREKYPELVDLVVKEARGDAQ
jgi:TRAP-type transport system periplasmic protein